MTPKRIALMAVLVLTVAFLSPIAYLAGQRAGAWLTTPAVDRNAGPWPSLEEGERDPGSMGDRLKPAGSGLVTDI